MVRSQPVTAARVLVLAVVAFEPFSLPARAEEFASPPGQVPGAEPSSWPPAPPPAARETPRSTGTGNWYLDLAVPTGYLGGNTTYRISDYNLVGAGFESELRFQLSAPLLGVRARVGSRQGEAEGGFEAELTFLRSLGDGYGKVLDSDWLTNPVDIQEVGVAHPGKDIYSESTAALTATILEARAAWRMHPTPRLEIAPLAGLLVQHFSYGVSDTNQVGYGPYHASYTMYIPGSTATYEVTYQALYLGVRGEALLGERFRAGADVWFSPLVNAHDRDNHLLRQKVATTSANGRGVQAAASARFALSTVDALEAAVSYLWIDTTGMQQQTFYGGQYQGQSASVHDRITCSRTSVFFTYQHRM
jgi:hypothetical protein